MNCVILYDISTYGPQKDVLHFFQKNIFISLAIMKCCCIKGYNSIFFTKKKKPCVVGFFERDGLERTRQKGKK